MKFIVAVTKVEALAKIPSVASGETYQSPTVEVEAENLRSESVRFQVPTKDAPPIGRVFRITIEEV